MQYATRKWVLVWLTLSTAPAVAQPAAPGAGELMRDAGSTVPDIAPASGPTLEVPPTLQDTIAVPGATVIVSAFRFEGNTLLSSDELAAAIADFTRRPLTFEGLQNAAREIVLRYRRAGSIAFVFLPPQKITDGVVTMRVIEAVLGQIHVDGDVSRVPRALVREIVTDAHATGARIDAPQLERGILLANDLPGVAVSAALTPGATSGVTDLQLLAHDDAPFSGSVMLDNAGARATGEERLIGTVDWNSPDGYGDALSITMLASQLAHYGRVRYGIPVAGNAWRVGAFHSTLPYELGKEFSDLEMQGDGATTGVDVAYAWRRSRSANLFLRAAAEARRYENRSLGVVDSDYRLDRIALGVDGNTLDTIGNGGSTQYRIDVVAGNVDLDGSPNQADDAATAATHGAYQLATLDISRLQQLSTRTAVLARATAQLAARNLDSSEHFALGGPRAVRAYPVSEGSGDEGYVVSLEWRCRASATATVATFYDYGATRLHDDDNFAGAPGSNEYALQGGGLALLWTPQPRMNTSVTWARRVHDNPGRLSSGADRDGSLHRNRFWIELQYGF